MGLYSDKKNVVNLSIQTSISCSIRFVNDESTWVLLRLSNEGAKAILDQLPITTPHANAIANQNNVVPPNKINAIKGISVVPLV